MQLGVVRAGQIEFVALEIGQGAVEARLGSKHAPTMLAKVIIPGSQCAFGRMGEEMSAVGSLIRTSFAVGTFLVEGPAGKGRRGHRLHFG